MPQRDITAADPPELSGLGESRARVLHLLQTSAAPLGVSDVARKIRLHPNTARFHLDGLVESGLALRRTEERAQPGRPRALYTAAPSTPGAGRRSYRLLAEILTSYLASQTKAPARAAERAGEAWGRFLTQRPAPFRQLSADAATKQLVQTLDEIGFEPEAVTSGRRRRVLLHHCPFRETAEEYGEVVCSIHLGIMRGMLAELDAPLDAERLEPFVEPSLCVAHLVSRPSRPSRPGRPAGAGGGAAGGTRRRAGAAITLP